jgi:ribose transport system permease protein
MQSEVPVSSPSLAATAAPRENPIVRGLRVNGLPLAILAALLVVTAIVAPEFFQVRNVLNVSRQASIVGVIAIGMTFVILTGGIDLSVGSILALTAVVTADLVDAGVPVPLIAVVAIALGAAVGVVNGIGVAVLKIQPFIMTLATMVLFRGLTLRITDGGPKSFETGSGLMDFLGSGKLGPLPGPLVVFALIAVAGILVLRYLSFGRFLYAIGGSIEAARLSGVRTTRTLIAAYAVSGACAGIAGLMTAARLSVGDPLAGNLAELDAIAAVVIGGTSLMGGAGGAVGTVAGALLLAILSNVLNLVGVSPFDQQIVKGLVIIAAVLLAARATKRRFAERRGGGGKKQSTAPGAQQRTPALVNGPAKSPTAS